MGNKVETTHWKMAVIDRNTTVICDWFRRFFNHGRIYRRAPRSEQPQKENIGELN